MAKKKNNRYVPFNQVLESLLDENKVFPVLYLYQFSDLEGPDLESLKEIWPRVNPERRAALLEDLAQLTEDETTVCFDNLAIFALQDSDPLVRVNAINLLWDTENVRLAPRFIDLLNHDPDLTVRAAAAAALGKYVYMGEVETMPRSMLRKVEDALLRAHRESEQAEIRRSALESLGFSARPEVPPLIRKAYISGSRDWLVSALCAMGRSADNTWAPEVNRMLKHADDDVRVEAVRAAGNLELSSARRPLLAMLNSDALEKEMRLQVIWSLAKIGGEEVSEKLDELLETTEDEEETDCLEEAIELLTFTEDKSLFDMMELEDPDTQPGGGLNREIDPDAPAESEDEEQDWDLKGHETDGPRPDDASTGKPSSHRRHRRAQI